MTNDTRRYIASGDNVAPDARSCRHLWIAVLIQAVKELWMGDEDAYAFFFSSAYEHDRRLVVDLAGFEYQSYMRAMYHAKQEQEDIAEATRLAAQERADAGQDPLPEERSPRSRRPWWKR